MSFKFSNKVNYKLFTETLTKESSYILGLLWADGSVHKKSNSISIECVREDMNNFYPIFKTVGEFNLYYRDRENRRPQGTINCSSLELSNFLKENDYTNKSLSSPTKILSHIPENLHKYFFLGWSDGDGCFYHSKDFKIIQYVMSGTYDQDWSSLEKICNELNIKYKVDKIITTKNHKHSRLIFCRNEDILKFGNFMYGENGDLGLKRKYEKYKSIKNYTDSKETYTYTCYKNNEVVKSFDSLKSASDWVNRGRYVGGSINDSIIGRQPTAYGYKWYKVKTQ